MGETRTSSTLYFTSGNFIVIVGQWASLRTSDNKMAEVEEVSSLIGEIYDAALDPALWPSAFAKAREYTGSSQFSLFTQETIRNTAELYFSSGLEPEYERLYKEKYCRINPIFPTVTFFDIEETHWVPDVLPRDEFCRTRFFREYVGPQGFMDGVFANVDKSPTSCALVSLMRRMSDGMVDDELRRRFGLIVPHVRRAVLIGKVIDHHKVEAAALADALDGLSSAMLLVDGTGRIIHANASGHAMISEAIVLRAPNGGLRTFDPKADQALLDIFTAASAGDHAVGVKGIAVPLVGRNGDRYVAHVLPLTAGKRRRAGTEYRAAAALFVRKAALELPSPFEMIAQQFKLTSAELRVLFALIEVGGVPEVAEVLGVTQATVKTHLHHVFEKTDTGRQVDLVKLVAGFTNPLLE
jgi:DNA-binding CsgD family transcriptional regulator